MDLDLVVSDYMYSYLENFVDMRYAYAYRCSIIMKLFIAL